MSPLVSVIISYYNDEKFLAQSIESILSQSYSSIELILLNHACTDSSRNIAHSFKDSRIIHIDMEKNLGAGSGIVLQKALDIARGEYVKLFCADDILNPTAIEELVHFMEQNPHTDFCFANLEYIDEQGNSLKKDFFSKHKTFSLSHTNMDCLKILKNGENFLPLPGSFIKKAALNGISFESTMILLFDASIWLELLLRDKQIAFYNAYIGKYRINDGQISGQSKKNISRNYFEPNVFIDIFANCKNINTIKATFDTYTLFDKLYNEKFIPFCVYMYYLTYSKNMYAYMQLQKIFCDENFRQEILDNFAIDIADFREIYSNLEINENLFFGNNIKMINLLTLRKSSRGIDLVIGRKIKIRLYSKKWFKRKTK